MAPVRLTVLISGNGSNLQSLIDSSTSASPTLPNARITHVISNKKDAYGLTRARNAGIATSYHNLVSGKYSSRFPSKDRATKFSPEAREAYDEDLASLVLSGRSKDAVPTAQDEASTKPDLVVCAGWMHIVSARFLRPLAEANVPIINLHPALPGEYNGANAIGRAFADWQAGKIKRTGCMIHYVIEEVDMGKPIVTQEVPFKESESEEAFEERMHSTEHSLIVEGTRRAIENLKS